MSTAIEWTDETWNPVSGCTKVSPGCAYCYAERVTKRFGRGDFSRVVLHADRLDQPLRWRKPRRVFVDSMGDLFHEDVPTTFIRQVFRIMEYTPQHTYQVLTKRPERVHREWKAFLLYPPPSGVAVRFKGDAMAAFVQGEELDVTVDYRWPPNVQLGVSAENQRMADLRVPFLLNTPAAVRFVSLEPLLGAIDLVSYRHFIGDFDEANVGLDWVIAGGESGGPANRRLVERCNHSEFSMQDGVRYKVEHCPLCQGTGWRPKPETLAWVRAIRDQCIAAGTPFFWKQWGGLTPRSGGALLDGHEWRETP